MKTHMEQEIEAQTSILENLISKYIVNYCILVNFPCKYKRIKFVASGSSYHAAKVAEKFFYDIAGVEANSAYSSEFVAIKDIKIDPEMLYFFVSQSGETTDTVTALNMVKKAGGATFALTNCETSRMNNEADYAMTIEAGKENSIAATKSLSATLFAMWLCALKLAQSKSIDISEYIENIENLPSALDDLIKNRKQIEVAAGFISKHKSFPIVGYNYFSALAIEGALKIKETSYCDANAYPVGEFLHGHTAILNEQNCIVEIFTDEMNALEKKAIEKIKADYNPKVLAITDMKNYTEADCTIVFPKYAQSVFKYFSVLVILQLLAFENAKKLKRNVDCPRGLSKVVQV